jgi:hypothetical protein
MLQILSYFFWINFPFLLLIFFAFSSLCAATRKITGFVYIKLKFDPAFAHNQDLNSQFQNYILSVHMQINDFLNAIPNWNFLFKLAFALFFESEERANKS